MTDERDVAAMLKGSHRVHVFTGVVRSVSEELRSACGDRRVTVQYSSDVYWLYVNDQWTGVGLSGLEISAAMTDLVRLRSFVRGAAIRAMERYAERIGGDAPSFAAKSDEDGRVDKWESSGDLPEARRYL